MRRPRADGPTRVGDVLDAALGRLPDAQRIADHALWAHWNDVVGATLARHAQPVRLRRGMLMVAVASAEWMQEIVFLKHELRDRLNARLGRAVVRDIFLVLESDA